MKKVFKMLSVILSLYSINYCHGQVCGSLFPVKNIHPYSNQILIQDANKLINTYTTNAIIYYST
jgi:hypothetical protein